MVAGNVGGQTWTLDMIRDKLRKMGDPRIHTAIVNAAASAPNIQPWAYLPAWTDSQLTKVHVRLQEHVKTSEIVFFFTSSLSFSIWE